jgi:3-methyladenine DNA glycosylase AlkD
MSHETALDVEQALRAFSHPDKVKDYQWFFKTGPGQYGEGDVFIGVRVPENRSVAKRFRNIGEAEITELTHSPIHELRQCGLFILVDKFKRAKTESARKEHFDHYMHLVYEGRVNNWDLVDATAPYLGAWLIGRSDALELMSSLAASEKLWERRVGMIFTFAFIRVGELEPTFEIAKQLLGDKHDLMHKAVGWMLREAGKKDLEALRAFLREFTPVMPRTALRYAIEKMDETERKIWMAIPRA